MSGHIFHIDAKWDPEAKVWVATSSDIPGLVIQGKNKNEIVEKLRVVSPALVETGIDRGDEFEIHFLRQREKLVVSAVQVAA
jgi:hypothetical protein